MSCMKHLVDEIAAEIVTACGGEGSVPLSCMKHLVDEIAAEIVTACGGNFETALRIAETSLYLGGKPGLRTCRICGDIDQPEYRHFTSEHVYEQYEREEP